MGRSSMAPGLTLNQARVRFVHNRTRLCRSDLTMAARCRDRWADRRLDRYHSLSSAGILAYELTDWVNSTPLRKTA